jgi:hypothetical protein
MELECLKNLNSYDAMNSASWWIRTNLSSASAGSAFCWACRDKPSITGQSSASIDGKDHGQD